jgi:hypothetical protein
VPGEYMSIPSELAVTAEKVPSFCKPQRVLWQLREGVACDDVWMHARRPTRRTILRRSRDGHDRALLVLSILL